MFLRVFIINEHGRLDSYSGDKFADVVEYGRWIMQQDNRLIPFAYETTKPAAQSQRELYDRCLQAVNVFRLLPGWGQVAALNLLKKAGIKMGILVEGGDDEWQGEEKPVIPITPAKPKLQIVQDFIEEIEPEELARRAAEATKAICGGGKL